MTIINKLFRFGPGFCLLLITGCSPVLTNTNDPAFEHQYGTYNYCGIKAVKQIARNSCGIASLTAVLNYWGVDVTEQEIIKGFPKSSKEGYSIVELRDIAKGKGLEAYVVSLSENPAEQLREQLFKGRPLVCAMHFPRSLYFAYDIPIYGQVYRGLLWSLGPRKDHYIVIFGINSQKLLMMDPSRGFVAISEKQFESCWKKKNYATLICGRKNRGLTDRLNPEG